ncbi:MAG TPA: pyruvate kinase [Chloroflexota bacterium]|jgi:pyruvate kinase
MAGEDHGTGPGGAVALHAHAAGELAGGRRTKIVATLGPATSSPERIGALIHAGVDMVRLNFSHGTRDEHAAVYRTVRERAAGLGRTVAIMQDLQGPKIRVGALAGGGPLMLADGQEITITAEPGVLGHDSLISTTYAHLPYDVRSSDRVLLDDGLLELRVLASDPPRVRALVVHGGPLGEHKGINLPGVAVSAPALTDKDAEDLAFGLALGVDYVALSFVRRADDVLRARELMHAHQHPPVPIIVKLEKPEAIAELDAIVRVADGVMVARGDLAVEMSAEEVPPLQKRIIHKANVAGKPVITATQMLQSMTTNPRPTRAEASDVANAVLDGSDAVMLSGETAVGMYPVETVQAMARICVAAEALEPNPKSYAPTHRSRAYALVRAACGLADDVEARAVVVFTRSGHTGQLVSECRPAAPIYALTDDETVRRRLALYWGVEPFLASLEGDTDTVLARVSEELAVRGVLARGDLTVIVGAARRLVSGRADLIKLHVI